MIKTLHWSGFLDRNEKLIVGLLVGIFSIVALSYSLGPILEGPDEIGHYRYVRVLVETKALPNPFELQEDVGGGQYHHPPMYYALQAPLAALIDDVDFNDVLERANPFAGYAFAEPGNDNKTGLVHAESEGFPYTGSPTALRVHLIRLVSVLLGTGTLLVCYQIACLVWPARVLPRLMTITFVAFMPQFTYMNSVINSSVLLYFLSTLSLLLLLRLMIHGYNIGRSVALGVALGLVLLTKVNATFLVFPVGLALLMDFRKSWKYAFLILGLVLAIAAWWYIRNLVLFGNITGITALDASQPGELIQAPLPEAIRIAWQRLPFAYQTFWARFGGAFIPLAPGVYKAYNVLTLLIVIGVVTRLMFLTQKHNTDSQQRAQSVRIGMIVAVYGLSWLLLLFVYSTQAWSGIQGRYVFPGIVSLGIAFALSFDWVSDILPDESVLAGATVILGTGALYALLGVFLPAYRTLPSPDDVQVLHSYTFDGVAEITGATPAVLYAKPGDTVHFTVVWQALKETDQEYTAYLHNLEVPSIRRDSYPGTGTLRSSDWDTGQEWAERYVIAIPDETEPQRVTSFIAGLSRVEDGSVVSAIAGGEEVVPFVGQLVIQSESRPTNSTYIFADKIGLEEPLIRLDGNQVNVCLAWEAIQPMDVDYKLFIHLLPPDQEEVLAQYDASTGNGQYPTWAWAAGERIEECVSLEIPSSFFGEARLAFGLYDLRDAVRLSVTDREGNGFVENRVLVAIPEEN